MSIPKFGRDLLLCLGMVAPLAACSSSDGGQADGGQASESTTSLQMAT